MIPEYNLSMNSTLGNNGRVYDFWRDGCLLNSVLLTNNQNIRFINVLTKNYQMAFCDFIQRDHPSNSYIEGLLIPSNFIEGGRHWERRYLERQFNLNNG